MRPIVLDFETYFDSDYTLKKMTTEAYVRDPRFQALCLGWCDGEGSGWVAQEEIKGFLDSLVASDCCVVAHHAQFDGLILSHHYGFRPRAWVDTLSMSRLVLGTHVPGSLGYLAQYYGLPEKTVPYDLFRGRLWGNLWPHERTQVGEGARHDAELTWRLFSELAKGFPQEEYRIIDHTVRLFTEPVLQGSSHDFEKLQHDEWLRKEQQLVGLGVTRTDLQSAATFVALLEAEGVDVDHKEGKNGPIPAIAKTDNFLQELTNDANPRVAALAEARLDVRSTIAETRAGRLCGMSERGSLCVYLKYFGAHTGRWSGGDRVNWQNLTDELASHVSAPPGYLLGTVDFAQIECRILNYLAGEQHVLDAFREGRDLYSEMAGAIWGREINKRDNPFERSVGKTVELGAGYGMGAPKLQKQFNAKAAISDRPEGRTGNGLRLSADDAATAVAAYRNSHPSVVVYWRQAGRMISALAGTQNPVQWGPMEVHSNKIILPNGIPLHYPNLKFIDNEWSYDTRRGRAKIYGGKLVENVVQALARVVMSQAILRVENITNLKYALTTHDDVVWLIPDDQHAEETLKLVSDEMARSPEWLPGIPLATESKLKRTLA